MALFISKTGTRLLLTAGALCVFALTAPATAGFAQGTSDISLLQSRLNQLENQVQTLSRSVFRGETPPPGAFGGGGAASSAVASFEERLGQIESQQRDLTGQLEELMHRTQQNTERLERMQQDYDMRLQTLEQGGNVSSTSSSAPQQSGTYLRDDATMDPYYQKNAAPSQALGSVSNNGAAAVPEALYEQAFSDIRDARYAEAEAGFSQFLTKYPAHQLAPNAQYWMAETHYVRGDYKKSAKQFAQGYQDYPKSSKAADNLLKLGLSLSKMKRKDDACLSFEQLKKEFPGESTPTVRRALAEMKRLGC